ncbi:MAG: glycoside hydrolase family 43 protein [Firmicutes bacterium]|nr:glycoside hydrolase family 43 protein [Bacillota bacterium]
MILNPILPGFHSDPCLCARGDDYYLACSTFEWFPGIPVYHSKDLKHWELQTHLLRDAEELSLRGLPSAKGIWAPCLSWCEEDQHFYLVYGVMRSMNARFFDVDNYVISAPEIEGPWSKPVYLHSAGFDASMFHDDDGRKWIVSLEWETRDDRRKPGGICLVKYDPAAKQIVGYPKRISMGATMRGCVEGPHLYKKNGYYYLLCAEGGTGYYHSVTLSRAKDIFGPYESCPHNPILTSAPENRDESADTDHLKPRYYNPKAPLQKAGHGSLAETPAGEVFMAFHCSRPFVPELCCTLGREAAIQKMEWTQDGWLQMAGGGNLVKAESEEASLPVYEAKVLSGFDAFDEEELRADYYAPRIDPRSFADLKSRRGWVRIRGQESLSSTNRVSLLARKLTCVHAEVMTLMQYEPDVYQHSAGLVLYYDSMNYVWLRKTFSEEQGCAVLSVQEVDRGTKNDHREWETPAPSGSVWLKLKIEGKRFGFSWSADGKVWNAIGPDFATWHLSDEHSGYGEFTGTMFGIAAVDSMLHRKTADFEFLSYLPIE